jgi:CRISPR-associated protein Csx16
MTVYWVSRHPGAIDWAREAGVEFDAALGHFDASIVRPGDTVLGTLPVHLAAEVCARGARYLHLSLGLARTQRGRELSAQQLRECGARLAEYRIEAVA